MHQSLNSNQLIFESEYARWGKYLCIWVSFNYHSFKNVCILLNARDSLHNEDLEESVKRYAIRGRKQFQSFGVEHWLAFMYFIRRR